MQENFDETTLEKLTKDKFLKILELDIFKEIKGFKLYKEQPFISYVPANMVDEDGTENVLLQGVIDLLAVDGDRAYIIDYKHSGVGSNACGPDLPERFRCDDREFTFSVRILPAFRGNLRPFEELKKEYK